MLSGTTGVFSAGLDIPLLVGLDGPGIALLWRELYALMKSLASSSIPIAAAMTGHAPAGGTVLALFCDWRVAARVDFKLGLSEVQVGIPLPPVDLVALFQAAPEEELRKVMDAWWSSETQSTLHALVERMGKKAT